MKTHLFYPVIIALLLLLCGGSAWSAQQAVVELKDGSRLQGEVLRKDEKTVYLYLGEQVIPVRLDRVKKLTMPEGKKEKASETRTFDYYRTGDRPVKSVSSHARELGPAVVVVKTPAGTGTGWFCHPDGYVVTNQHVIAGERSIQITAFRRENGRMEKEIFKNVKLVAHEPHIDLALLHIEEEIEMDIPWLYLGDSTEVEEGDQVFTIGNPLGLERSTAKGIISKSARNFKGRLFLQTTAPIAPGNSGGPLFNDRGEVIGVVSMGYLYFDGLGFAIPSEYIKEFLNNVEAYAFDPDNPNTGVSYMEAPITTTDKSVKFTDSDFIKVGAGVSCLTLADVNGDGVDEVLFVDNNKAEVGILRRRQEKPEKQGGDYVNVNRLPPSEHFKKETIAVNNKITSIAVTDVNEDGRKDILFIGDIDGLGVLEQKKDGTFASSRSIERINAAKRRDALKVADFDGDDAREIFVLGRKQFYLFEPDGTRREFALSADFRDNITDYHVLDANDDGRLDLLFFSGSKLYATHLYTQDKDGNFVTEQMIHSHLSGPVRAYHRGKGRRFLTLDKGRNRVRELALSTEKQSAQKSRINVAGTAIMLGADTGLAGDFEVADLDGDGRSEVMVANTARNEFVLVRPRKNGFNLARSPSPRQVDSMEAVKLQDGRAALFSASVEERMFGLSRVGEDGISFPRPINTAGTVLSVSLHRVDGKKDSLVWVERTGNNYVIQACPAAKAARKVFDSDGGSIDVDSTKLRFGEEKKEASSALSNQPSRLSFADFNGDGKSDLVVQWAYSGKESLYLGQGGGFFKPIIAEKEFLEQLEGQPLVLADVDADGAKDVLLVRPGFVRILKVDKKGKLYAEKQVNWDFGKVDRLVPVPGRGKARFIARADGEARLVELDVKQQRFESIARLDLTGLGGGRLQVADVDGNEKPDLLLLDKNVLRILLQKRDRSVLDARTVFDARMDRFKYWDARPVNLDGKQGDEVLLFDSKKPVFEICRPRKDGTLETLCRNRLFEKTIRQEGENKSYELPQEAVVGDVDGNGDADMIFILQDRLAIYLQNAGE